MTKIDPQIRSALSLAMRAEIDENACRKDLTPSEWVKTFQQAEEIAKRQAKERVILGKSIPVESFPHGSKGRSRDKVAALIGISGRNLDKARAIVRAAEAEPENEKIAKLVEDMDRTGSVNNPYKRLKVLKQAEMLRAEPPPLPQRGPYRVVVADPPWQQDLRQEDPTHSPLPYPQMTVAAICALPVASLVHEDSILWLWTTNFRMREAFAVLDAWGFQHRTILTWVKDRFGTGDWLRGQTEHCIMAVRGRPVVQLTNQTTVLYGPVRAHSQKPEEFYAFVERLCPAPRYAELFSRQHRENWDGHGDELPAIAKSKDLELPCNM